MINKNRSSNDNDKRSRQNNGWREILFYPANIFLGFLLSFLIGVSVSLLGGKNVDIFIVGGLLFFLMGLFLNTDFRQNPPVLSSACQKKFVNKPYLRTFFDGALNKTESRRRASGHQKTVFGNSPIKIV